MKRLQMAIGDKLTRFQLGCLIVVWAVLVAIVSYVVYFLWIVNGQVRIVEAKVAQMQRMTDGEVDTLARACAELAKREAGIVEEEEWPIAVRNLAPQHVSVSGDDVQLYISGGFMPFVILYFHKRNGGELELIAEDNNWALWPRRDRDRDRGRVSDERVP